MKVVTVASRKGGGGKSTVVRHLAIEAAIQGDGPVCIIDADPMLGLAQWWSRRVADEPRLLHSLITEESVTAMNVRRLVGEGNLPLPIEQISSALKSASRAGYKICIIDTAPAADNDVRTCVRHADLVLMPVRATQDDLDAVGETLKLVKSEGRAGAFVLNAAQKGALSTRAAANALVHKGELAEPTIHRAEAIPASRSSGETIGELAPGSSPAEEFQQLWRYVSWRLGLREQPDGILSLDAHATPKSRKGRAQ